MISKGAGHYIIPKLDMREQLKDSGGSSDMNIDGSVTPVEFSFTSPPGETWNIIGISVVLTDMGTMDPTDFGAINGGLTNGVDFEVQTNGILENLGGAQNNLDLALLGVGPGFTKFDSSTGFMSTADIFLTERAFPKEMILFPGDFFKVRINDDLTGLNFLRFLINKWRFV